MGFGGEGGQPAHWDHAHSPTLPDPPTQIVPALRQAVGAEQPRDVGAPGTHPGSCHRASSPGARLGEHQGGRREAVLFGALKRREERHLPQHFVQLLGSLQFGATGTPQRK